MQKRSIILGFIRLPVPGVRGHQPLFEMIWGAGEKFKPCRGGENPNEIPAAMANPPRPSQKGHFSNMDVNYSPVDDPNPSNGPERGVRGWGLVTSVRNGSPAGEMVDGRNPSLWPPLASGGCDGLIMGCCFFSVGFWGKFVTTGWLSPVVRKKGRF